MREGKCEKIQRKIVMRGGEYGNIQRKKSVDEGGRVWKYTKEKY